MNERESLTELDNAISNLCDARSCLNRTKPSKYLYQDWIEQYISMINTFIDEIRDIHYDLNEDMNKKVRDALKTDRQYAFESIEFWMSKDEDVMDIALRLKTTTDTVIQLIDEHTKER